MLAVLFLRGREKCAECALGGPELSDRLVDPGVFSSEVSDHVRARLGNEPFAVGVHAVQDLRDDGGGQSGGEQSADAPDRDDVGLAVLAVAVRPPGRPEQALLLVVAQQPFATPVLRANAPIRT